jgi:hypothetical protein
LTVTGNAWWVGCGHNIKPFISTTMRCHFLRNQQKRCSKCREYNTLKIRYSLWFVVGGLYYSLTPTSPLPSSLPPPDRQDNNMESQCAALWDQLWKPSPIPSNQ